MAVRLPTATRNALANAVTALVDAGPAAGQLRVYTGTQPASANDAASGTLLATATLVDPSFGAAAAGVITLTDPASVNATATGTAGWFRVVDSAGATVFDGSVTATGGGGDLTLNTTALTTGVAFDVTGGTVTMPG